MLPGLVSADDLYEEIADDRPPVVIDVRFQSAHQDYAERYRKGHIRGAIFADTVVDLSGTPAPGEGLRPIPLADAWQNTLRRWGLEKSSRVVVYDDHLGLSAGRAWWLLKWAGIVDVRLLDRGYLGWCEEGFETSNRAPDIRPSRIVISPGQMPSVSLSDIEDVVKNGCLIDVRSEDEFLGDKTLPNIPARGHIPGAINIPMEDGFTALGRHKTEAAQRSRYAHARIDCSEQIALYCGAGGGAAHEIFVLSALGIKASLFMGSWSAWSTAAQFSQRA